MTPPDEPRFFAVDSAGVAVDLLAAASQRVVADAETMLVFENLGITDEHVPALMEAAEIMAADGVPEDMIGQMLVACHRSGREPVAFARHFIKLRKAIR